MTRIFNLRDGGQPEPLEIHPDVDYSGVTYSIRREFDELLRIRLPEPLQLRAIWRKELKPREHAVLWTYYEDFLIRRDLLDDMNAEGFTGYRDQKIVLVNEKNEELDVGCTYHRILRFGWGGMAHPDSGVHLMDGYDYAHPHYTSCECPEQFFDENQWDGSDFFMIWPLPVFIMVTEKVARWFRKRKVKNVRLVPLEELHALRKKTLREKPSPENWPEALKQALPEALKQEIERMRHLPPKEEGAFSPGLLSDWLPDDLARKYGELLGIY